MLGLYAKPLLEVINKVELRKAMVGVTYLSLLCCVAGQFCVAEPLLVPSPEIHTRDYAIKFTQTANTVLAPVYAPLAEQIVSEFQLAEVEGVRIEDGF